MLSFKTTAIGLCLLTLTAGAAAAQNTMTTGSPMAKPMTAAQTKMMKSCQSMDHDMMMKNKSCMKMMKMHPEMGTDMTNKK